MATVPLPPFDFRSDVCAIGGVNDGTLRVCCSTHRHILCAHHYAVTHFVETAPEFDPKRACNALRVMEAMTKVAKLRQTLNTDVTPAEWDVFRDQQGKPVTINEDQLRAIWHAVSVVEQVRRSTGHQSLWDNPHPNLYKSRLLGRMLLDGLPPTTQLPPKVMGGPDWAGLPGGDPYIEEA